MNPWLFWAQLWVSFWDGLLRRPRVSAQIFRLDDYRPSDEQPPRNGNGRAA